MPKGANRQAVAILIIIHQTLPKFELGKEFDKSNPYIKFGRNLVIKD